MRWLLFVASAALFSLNVHAAEPVADEAVSFVDASTANANVTVTPIPMPAQVTELLTPVNPAAKLRAAKKAKLAKKKAFPQTLLTRTERHQMALLVALNKRNGHSYLHIMSDEEGPAGYDELVLHQFYNRPRLVVDDEDDHGIVVLSDTARVRLLMARLKALETLALSQVEDDGAALPDTVTQRLAAARLKAVEAHQNKFS